MKSAIFLFFVPIMVHVLNGSSISEISCYERGFRDGEEHPFDQNTYMFVDTITIEGLSKDVYR